MPDVPLYSKRIGRRMSPSDQVHVKIVGRRLFSFFRPRRRSEKHHGVKEIISEKGDTSFQYNIEKNPDLAKNLKGRLLLSHGEIDNNVHPANSIRVVNALIKANKRFDMIVLPTQRHGFGDMTEYFFWKMSDYFSRYLIGDTTERPVDEEEMNREMEQSGNKRK